MDTEDKLNNLAKKIGKMYRKPMRYLDDIERWIAYRTYDRYHVVNIPTLEPNYYDKDSIFLHACFALLTDYVEVELGCRQKTGSKRNYDKEIEQENKLYASGLPILGSLLEAWHDNHFLPIFIHRLFSRVEYSREAGLDYLTEYQKMKPQFPDDVSEVESVNHHVAIAKEIQDLYLWWHDVYLKRLDEMDESGVSAYYDKMREKYGETHRFVPTSPEEKSYTMEFTGNKEEEEELDRLHHLMWDLEEARNKEDEEMLIRLVKIRRSLWT
jgi:hypothetical protein